MPWRPRPAGGDLQEPVPLLFTAASKGEVDPEGRFTVQQKLGSAPVPPEAAPLLRPDRHFTEVAPAVGPPDASEEQGLVCGRPLAAQLLNVGGRRHALGAPSPVEHRVGLQALAGELKHAGQKHVLPHGGKDDGGLLDHHLREEPWKTHRVQPEPEPGNHVWAQIRDSDHI